MPEADWRFFSASKTEYFKEELPQFRESIFIMILHVEYFGLQLYCIKYKT